MTSLDEETKDVIIYWNDLVKNQFSLEYKTVYILQHIERISAQLSFSASNRNGLSMNLFELVELCKANKDLKHCIPFNYNLRELMGDVIYIMNFIESKNRNIDIFHSYDYNLTEAMIDSYLRFASSFALLNIDSKQINYHKIMQLDIDQFRIALKNLNVRLDIVSILNGLNGIKSIKQIYQKLKILYDLSKSYLSEMYLSIHTLSKSNLSKFYLSKYRDVTVKFMRFVNCDVDYSISREVFNKIYAISEFDNNSRLAVFYRCWFYVFIAELKKNNNIPRLNKCNIDHMKRIFVESHTNLAAFIDRTNQSSIQRSIEKMREFIVNQILSDATVCEIYDKTVHLL